MRLICTAAFMAFALPVSASEVFDTLAKTLRLNEVAEILQEEGARFGEQLNTDFLNGEAGAFFEDRVGEIYNADRISGILHKSMSEALTQAHAVEVNTFFGSALGQKIISLENSARRAFADPTIEDYATSTYRETDAEDPRLLQVAEYIEVNDLIERNIEGTLRSDYKFFAGLADGQGVAPNENALLADLWAQREETRQQTENWLFGFLLMAYQPLSDAEMDENIAFSRSEAGQSLNRALFAGFDQLYEQISYEMGHAVGFALMASDL